MFCQKCGAELTPGAVFCIMCGNKVPSFEDFETAIEAGVPREKNTVDTDIIAPSIHEKKDTLTDSVIRFQNGDQNAFDTIYDQSKRYVYYTILKTTGDKDVADDILQETYLDVYKSLNQLQNPEAFKGWAVKIAQHKISRYYQKKNPELFSTEEEMDDAVYELTEEDTSALPEDAMINKEVQRLISEIIDELPENQRCAIISFYYNQMSIPEIAESMDVPENTVKTYLFRGKKKIKDGVLEIEKKHGTKLYALPIAGLLGLLFTEEAKAAVVTQTASNIAAKIPALSSVISGQTMSSQGDESLAKQMQSTRINKNGYTSTVNDRSVISNSASGSSKASSISGVHSVVSNSAFTSGSGMGLTRASLFFAKAPLIKILVIIIVSIFAGFVIGRVTVTSDMDDYSDEEEISEAYSERSGSNARNPFIGEWRSRKYGSKVTINDDNTFVAVKSDGSDMITGTWVADKENIKFNEDLGFSGYLAQSMGIELKGKYDPETDTFALANTGSVESEIYERIK